MLLQSTHYSVRCAPIDPILVERIGNEQRKLGGVFQHLSDHYDFAIETDNTNIVTELAGNTNIHDGQAKGSLKPFLNSG